LLLALGAAGVTLAVVLGVIGLPAVNACAGDPRGVVTCLRDMADRKFDLPGSIPGQVAEASPVERPALPPAVDVAEAEGPSASGGPLEAPAVEPASASVEPVAAPAPTAQPAPEPGPVVEAPAATTPAMPQPAPVAPAAMEMAAAPEPEAGSQPLKPEVATAPTPGDTALNWSAPSVPQNTEIPQAPANVPVAEAPASQNGKSAVQVAEPAEVVDAPPLQPAAPAERATSSAIPLPEPSASPAATAPQPPLVVANAEPVTAQPPPPTVVAPVILAPTIDAIELDAGQSFVSGSGPAGALMRLYADGELVGESPVQEGRWLIEGSNLLDRPRRELRVEALEPDTGKLLGVAAITVEIELPDGGAPPDERPEATPDLGSGVAPAQQPDPAPPTLAAAPAATAEPAELANSEPLPTIAVPEDAPATDPALVIDPAPTELKAPDPTVAAIEPELEPEALPPLAAVVPRGESASVEILAPSTLMPTTLPQVDQGAGDASVIALPTPDRPALVAEFAIAAPDEPVPPRGQPVTILRLLPFGDPDEGRYNVGKAIIRRGDTLWSIARRYYGHGIHYRTIFHANRDQIHRPSRIFPGQIFDLPLVTDD
jgi:nucleoid-associated protein YgaU